MGKEGSVSVSSNSINLNGFKDVKTKIVTFQPG